ncbi:MAG: GntR family transcriptional regulator [Clostridiales bacterium]|uniref:GntR family transcriptional regulator n=1 Tax=Aminipila sp. TaxID=2060095 RepID=UPI001DE4EDB9|nr:GntR family transcriptional regulator [Aminipila sp.]MBE6033579.1 GntR family transcriptional regulator [Clostridiales bacterium]
MNIIISNSNGQPIYEQIVTQIRNQILTKELLAGDALPSMRLLARELKISVITTKRAYEELEKEGLIESYTGKGSFVKAQNAQQLKEQHLHEISLKLREVLELAYLSDIGLSEIIEILKGLQKGE